MSMRANHRPGASTSGGVGSRRLGRPEPAQALLPGSLQHALDEGVAPLDLGPAEGEAEQALHVGVGGVGLDPPAPHGLGDAARRADQAAADLVDDVVDVADHHGDDRVEARLQGPLRRRLEGAEEHGGVAQRVLERGLVAEGRGVDRAERFLDGARVGLEAGDVLGEQAFERRLGRGGPRGRRGW